MRKTCYEGRYIFKKLKFEYVIIRNHLLNCFDFVSIFFSEVNLLNTCFYSWSVSPADLPKFPYRLDKGSGESGRIVCRCPICANHVSSDDDTSK